MAGNFHSTAPCLRAWASYTLRSCKSRARTSSTCSSRKTSMQASCPTATSRSPRCRSLPAPSPMAPVRACVCACACACEPPDKLAAPDGTSVYGCGCAHCVGRLTSVRKGTGTARLVRSQAHTHTHTHTNTGTSKRVKSWNNEGFAAPVPLSARNSLSHEAPTHKVRARVHARR